MREAWEFAAFHGAGRPYVAVDPGLDTGVAWLTPDGSVYGGEDEWDPAMVAVRDALRKFEAFHPIVVCEAFIISAATVKKSQAPWSLEGIGVCRFLARRFNAELVLQQPNEAKRFATDPRLKHQGWYVPTDGGHLNDALRHLYVALAKRGLMVPPEGVV